MADFRTPRIIRGSEVGRPPPLVAVPPSRRIGVSRRKRRGAAGWAAAAMLLAGLAALAWARVEPGSHGAFVQTRPAPAEASR